jgi:hypothetical protein
VAHINYLISAPHLITGISWVVVAFDFCLIQCYISRAGGNISAGPYLHQKETLAVAKDCLLAAGCISLGDAGLDIAGETNIWIFSYLFLYTLCFAGSKIGTQSYAFSVCYCSSPSPYQRCCQVTVYWRSNSLSCKWNGNMYIEHQNCTIPSNFTHFIHFRAQVHYIGCSDGSRIQM